MTELYVRPTRDNADIVVRGDAAPEIAVAWVVNHMKQQLAEFHAG
jgi:uridine kinase